MSPISNNALFLPLAKNPFDQYFAVGLNVAMATADPLMFHHTKVSALPTTSPRQLHCPLLTSH